MTTRRDKAREPTHDESRGKATDAQGERFPQGQREHGRRRRRKGDSETTHAESRQRRADAQGEGFPQGKPEHGRRHRE